MINNDQNSAYQAQLSAWFNELAVILPNQVTQPNLNIMVTALQKQIMPAHEDGARHEQSISDIGLAHDVLEQLLTTDIADASVLVAITNEPKPRLLLTRRASHLNSHAGEVSFAGGKHESTDGNNVVTALREACEETALPPSKVKLVGQLPIQTSKSGMSVRPIVALIDPDVIYVPELGEIERIFWADFDKLITQPTTDYEIAYRQEDQMTTIITPCWIIDNETVWGLTGRILASLFEIAYNRQTPWYYRPVEC